MDDEAFDEAAFDAWLAGDPGRRRAFETMWQRIMGSDMDAALRTYKRRGAARAWLAGGAAALVVLAGGYKIVPLVELNLASPQRYTVAEGRIREVVLADGTQLTLARDADVRVRYTDHARVVELTRGTIFADVTHDKARPFRVETGEAHVVVLGTSFEVLKRQEDVRVSVASGVVRFGEDGWFNKPISLTAQQAAVLDQRGLARTADVTGRVANWRREWVEYRGASLQQVVADLQSLSPLPIEIAESLGDKRVSGRIRLTDPIGQLQNLAITHGFQLRQTDQALVISRK
ncbi:FecR family protein [Sphingosinicella microcystinivorans]|uniref:FecR family protein n=1 Tax=Sphingosinicella microcystinivorans TaxID=335406 RepID=A0AAD1D3Y0_SPHMI|nr:FecR domain-containing protein [Sphingosinicella microcystinivorans]RKS85019.1 FecR family protein [Sphingosinicella microcystinivorans]BBE33323.1 transcriptional regulator [Sphingosinicella microcystinivorans]